MVLISSPLNGRDLLTTGLHCPFLGTLNIRCRIIIGIQNGTIMLTTTHVQNMHAACVGEDWRK